ncbi:hypothetical protein RRG08_028391 [Elysia crispata]|uniref:PiggyBac transposable element-derived protein domain-containing protein n=1 Tax=Elysia crispata TaxID=231223 RepID=A0AAE1E6I1_9GAST|nr:hypothetical protein RRG08_028391 [Elysia crispata]
MHLDDNFDVETKKPEIVMSYNATKGGVDSMDQMYHAVTTKRKTNRWPMLLFYNVHDLASIAALVVWRKVNSSEKLSDEDRRVLFIITVAEELVRPQLERRQIMKILSRHLKFTINTALHQHPTQAQVGEVSTPDNRKCVFVTINIIIIILTNTNIILSSSSVFVTINIIIVILTNTNIILSSSSVFVTINIIIINLTNTNIILSSSSVPPTPVFVTINNITIIIINTNRSINLSSSSVFVTINNTIIIIIIIIIVILINTNINLSSSTVFYMYSSSFSSTPIPYFCHHQQYHHYRQFSSPPAIH